MPLTMTLNRSNKTPLLTPCFDGRELHVDCELVNAGLSAISVKEYDAGDRRGEVGIRHRNSFWSVHRPELSKLSWAYNHKSQNAENYLKVGAGNQHSNEELKKSNVPPADFNQLTIIHANSEQRLDTDENYLLISKPQTTQFSDDDLASHTTLHKSRAEFCVTIGHLGEPSISDTSKPSYSKTVKKSSGGRNLIYGNDAAKSIDLRTSDAKMTRVFPIKQIVPIEPQENENFITFSQSYYKRCENFNKQQTGGTLPTTSQDKLIALMDDTTRDKTINVKADS